MIRMILKKINKSRWIVFCLALGLILSISIVTAIPMYSRAVLNKLINRDLQRIQTEQNKYPGYYVLHREFAETLELDSETGEFLNPKCVKEWYRRPKNYKSYINTAPEDLIDEITSTESCINKYMIPTINLNILSKTTNLGAYKLLIKEKKDEDIINPNKFGKINAVSEIQEHIKITDGRIFSDKQNNNGEYEVIISEQTAHSLNLFVDSSYIVYQPYKDYLNPDEYFKIKVVGIYTPSDTSDPFWYDWEDVSSRSILMDYNLFTEKFLVNNPYIVVNDIDFAYAFDYKGIDPDNAAKIVQAIDSQQKTAKNNNLEILSPMYYALKHYQGMENNVRRTLWIYEIPLLLMLIIFTFMVSSFMVEQDRDEIAIFKSRGAGNRDILSIYLYEGLFISIFGLIIGPVFGKFLCKMIGASNGFLEFVERKGLIVHLKWIDYLYSALVIALFLSTILISSYFAAKKSIVEQKQNKVQRENVPFWKKLYIDIVLLGICAYGYYVYKGREKMVEELNTTATSIPIDPLLYIMSTLFIIGCGLVFLRIYPYVIKGIYKIGKRHWPSLVYTSLLNTSRSGAKNQFIMLFLILTISTGIFDANTARSYNCYMEDQIKYLTGADMVIETLWESNIDSIPPSQRQSMRHLIVYKEPDFNAYKNIEGVDVATKVYIENSAYVKNNTRWIPSMNMMAIVPHEFGKVAWFNPKLNPIHWYNYLNYMTENPEAMLLSRTFEKDYFYNVGDKLTIVINNNLLEGVVCGFVDYWPTLDTKSGRTSDLIIANLDYINKCVPTQPYNVWIKKSPKINDEKLYSNIKNENLNIIKVNDANQSIIEMKNDPIYQGTNGTLSMGFIATIAITSIGFLIHWIMSIKSRSLQFGIFRAMGLTSLNVIQMLIWEQILVSGAAILAGTFIGQLNCKIFVPMIQMAFKKSQRILPFKIVQYSGDYIKLYSIIFAVLILGFLILARYIKRMKINQVLKLGED